MIWVKELLYVSLKYMIFQSGGGFEVMGTEQHKGLQRHPQAIG